ncbi:MAG: DNA replication and repair protein RecF [Patescibacteria group bacterium]|nr:DNA replication and repair protein RecF [Patescibacteria group bacterium]
MKIFLSNFRNIKEKKLDLKKTPLFIYGANGSGKTSILEAIYFLSTSKSFRHHQKNNLVNFKNDSAFLEFKKKKQILRIKINKIGKNQYYLNNKIIPRYKSINHVLAEVFWWGDFKLAYGGPEERRRFLNLLCLQVEPVYLQYLLLYSKILKERKFALVKKDHNLLDIWDKKISVVAEKLYIIRKKTLRLINQNLPKTLKKLRPKFKEPEVLYKGFFLNKEEFIKKLKANRQFDLLDFKTHFGPHRDDLKFCWHNSEKSSNLDSGKRIDLKNFSQGEVKSFLLGLKLNFLFNLTEKEKYFLIDDCFAEIDNEVILNLIKISQKKKIKLILTHQSKPKINLGQKELMKLL